MSNPPKGNYTNSRTVKYSKSVFTSSLEELATFENLFFAYKEACKSKQHRTTVFKFADGFGANLLDLQKRLLDGTYYPQPCHQFDLFCVSGQKVRHISAPVFEDCIVQHLIYQHVYDSFDKSLIYDSYGCRRDKGTHKATDRFQSFLRKAPDSAYILQLDVRKYYYRIDHSILRECLERRVKDPRIVDIMMMFVNHEEGIGLRVGNLLSQLYGMLYLDRVDHYIKRTLGIKCYVRYVDDMIMLVESREHALHVRDAIARELSKIHLELSKWKLNAVKHGANFVGFRTWKHKRILRRRSAYNFSRKLRDNKFESVFSILSHARHTSCYKSMLKRVLNKLGDNSINIIPSIFIKDALRLNLIK